MPIYEYQCSRCSHQFEVIQGVMNRESKILCPRCGESGVQRLVSLCSSSSREAEGDSSSGCSSKPSRFT